MRLSSLVAILCGLTACTKPVVPDIDPAATVRFLSPEAGEVAPQVARQLSRASGEHRQVLVYVGAPWCEPCRLFHEAVDRGELTGKLGALDLIAFDAEPDAERLLMSGYESQLIPAFTLPAPDGRASTTKLEGSIKGSAAVADLVPRLRQLLAGPSR